MRLPNLVWMVPGLLWIGACAVSREIRCPDPIGPIVRDECEAYQTRYEALKVSLGASLGPLGVEGSLGQTNLRNPSEWLQLLSARMLALCHDFNACRMSHADYSRRREELDRNLTALTVIQEQLKAPGLKQPDRRLLLERLLALLGEPSPKPEADSATPKPIQPSATVSKPKHAYSSSQPWMESLLLPPMPAPVQAGFPLLLSWPEDTLDVVWIPKSPETPHDMKIGGYAPRVALFVSGQVEADDRLEIRFSPNQKFSCPVRRNGSGVFRLSCPAPKDFYLTTPRFSYQVGYHRASEDRSAVLGTLSGRVLNSVESSYATDHSPQLEEGWLVFQPEPQATPPDFERPALFVSLQLRRYEKATARCFVGNQPITGALKSERGSGQSGTFQDRPRYREISPGHSQGVAEPFIEWWHYGFPLPFLVARGQDNLPEGFAVWPPQTGEWLCRVSVEGEVVRELRFQVKADGRLEPREGQRGRSGDLAHPWWRVETRVVPNQKEAKREDPAALGRP